MKATDDYKVLVIDKLCRIVEALRNEKTPVGVNDLSRKVSLNVATTFRILRTLMDYGWIYQNSEGKYSIGCKLAYSYDMEKFYLILKDVSYCVMRPLTDREGEVLNLSVRFNDKGKLIQQTRTSKIADYVADVGSQFSLHATACGKIFLADMPDGVLERCLENMEFTAYTERTITDKDALKRELYKVRERGYACDVGESLRDANCIGVAVRGPMGEVVAALSFSGIIQKLTPEREMYYFGLLKTASQRIADILFESYAGPLPAQDDI